MSADITFADIKREMSGRELDFLRSIGIPEKALSGKHQECPGCGGKDRYRTDRKGGRDDGSFVCSQGGGDVIGGDWIEHACHAMRMTHQDVYVEAMAYLGLENDKHPKQVWDREKAAADKNKRDAIVAAKVKHRSDNEYFDFHVNFDLDELGFLIKDRGHSGSISLEEIAVAGRLIELLKSRYFNEIQKSSGFKRAERKRVKAEAEKSGAGSQDAHEYVESLNRMYTYGIDRELFITLAVRQMLIEKKSNNFIGEVVQIIQSVNALKPDKWLGSRPFQQASDVNPSLEAA